MAYATIADATEFYGDDYVTASCDRDNDGAIDTAATERMLEVATSIINSYLIGRVALPLETIPEDLKIYCVDIMIYRMCPDALRLTAEKKDRYKAATDWLRDVKSGKVRLAIGSSANPAMASANLVHAPAVVNNSTQKRSTMVKPGSRELTRDKLSGLL